MPLFGRGSLNDTEIPFSCLVFWEVFALTQFVYFQFMILDGIVSSLSRCSTKFVGSMMEGGRPFPTYPLKVAAGREYLVQSE